MAVGAAVVATATSRQPGLKSDPASANFAKENRSSKLNAANRTAIGNPLWAIPIKTLSVARERPLFMPMRHPPKPPMAGIPWPRPATPIEPEKPPLVLIGTVVSENDVIGIFRDQSTKRIVKLRRGASQYGWLLGRVNKKDAVLQKGDETVFLTLSADTSAPATAAMHEPEPRLVRRQR
jgi:general secretion pathway protein N